MSKVRLIIEVEIDEEELNSMKSSQNDYEPLTQEQYLKGLEFEFKDGQMRIYNEIEQYYNDNEGDSQCMVNPKLISKELIK